jgi:coenzyme PQQ precursor peptide PqqA
MHSSERAMRALMGNVALLCMGSNGNLHGARKKLKSIVKLQSLRRGSPSHAHGRVKNLRIWTKGRKGGCLSAAGSLYLGFGFPTDRSSQDIEGNDAMAWSTPEVREVCVGMEVTSYLSAEM